MQGKFCVITLLLFLFSIPSGITFAQVQLLTVSPPATAKPGDFVTHVFSIINLQAFSDTFTFTLSLPQGLSLVSQPGPITLGPGEEDKVFLTVFVSSAAKAGENILELTAISQADPAIKASATAIINVIPVAAVEVIAPSPVEADPGQTINLLFTVINRGNVLDEYMLSASSRSGFRISVFPEALALMPRERGEVTVTLSIPATAPPGSRDLVILVATSTMFIGVSAEAQALVIVLPPPPQAVGVTLFAEVPAELKLSTSLAEELLEADIDLLARGRLDTDQYLHLRIGLVDIFERWELENFLFLLELKELDFALGDITLSPARLVKLSGRGLLLKFKNIEEQASSLSISGALDQEDLLWALSFADSCGLNLGSRRSDEGFILDALGRCKLNELTLQAEGAISSILDVTDGAAWFTSSLRLQELSVSADLFRAGTNFAGSFNDLQGFNIFSRLSIQKLLSLNASFQQSSDNIEENPSLPTLTTTISRIGGSLSFEDLPTLRLQYEFEKQISLNPQTPTNKEARKLSFGLVQQIGLHSLIFFADSTRDSDYIAGTEFEYTRFGLETRLYQRPFAASLRFTNEETLDLKNNLLIARSFEAASWLYFYQERFSALLGLTVKDGSAKISTKIDSKLGNNDVSVLTDLAITLGAIALGAAFITRFDLPIPFIVTKGRVEGFIFIDDNGNKIKDPGEEGIPDLILSLDGLKVRSNLEKAGFYRFPPLRPGSYKLNIENLPAYLASANSAAT